MLSIALIVLGLVSVLMLIMFIFMQKAGRGGIAPRLREEERKIVVREEKENKEQPHHLDEIIKFDDIYKGIIQCGGMVYAIGRLSGANFTVISDIEQDSKEDMLISIFSQIDYPIQFITTTVVADTYTAAEEIKKNISTLQANRPEASDLKMYMMLYANELESLKNNRRIMSKQTWVVIGHEANCSDPVGKVRERMALLQKRLAEDTGIILAPVETTDEVIDIIHLILMPDTIVKPSERLAVGVTEPVHFKAGQIFN